MTVSLTLMLIGTDDDPRWVADVRPGPLSASKWCFCCKDGHFTPEAAAAHGSELAAARLSAEARHLQPPAYGAAVIQKLATA